MSNFLLVFWNVFVIIYSLKLTISATKLVENLVVSIEYTSKQSYNTMKALHKSWVF